jgi:hypothetical protein
MALEHNARLTSVALPRCARKSRIAVDYFNRWGVGRKNPIREASFVGWPETFRWDHDGCASVRACSNSLMSNGRRISSLFRRKFSLFDRIGNFIKKGNQSGRLGRCIRAKKAHNRENSLYFPWITGNRLRRMVR